MTARLTFDNVEFIQSSEQSVRVRQGQKFQLAFLEVPEEGGMQVATIEDRVLQVDPKLGFFEVTALVTGDSEIQLQSASRTVIFWLAIEVYNDNAVTLGVSANVEQQ